MTQRSVLIPILGDQLSRDISSLEDVDPDSVVLLMMEAEEETSYVRYHEAKIAFILSAMGHHAEDMRERGWTVERESVSGEWGGLRFRFLVELACAHLTDWYGIIVIFVTDRKLAC